MLSWSCWEDHCSEPVDGLHVVPFALPFNVFRLAGSTTDSHPKSLSKGGDLGRRLNSHSQRGRVGGNGNLEIGSPGS